jgi:hypothetical protein
VIRSVSTVRQAARPLAPQAGAPDPVRAAGPKAAGVRPAPITPQKYKDDVVRVGSLVAAALEQLRQARQLPGSSHHHQAVVRLEEAVSQLEALKRIETPVNWKWFHNMDRVVQEHLPELPEWARAELSGKTERVPAPAPRPAKPPTGRLTGTLKSAKEGLERARNLVKQQGGAAEIDWTLQRAVPLASHDEAVAIFDAVEAFAPEYRSRLSNVRKAALDQAIQTLPRPESAAGVRARFGKLYPDGARSEAVRELEHSLMRQVAGQTSTLPELLKLASRASWDIDRVKGTATANVALEQARGLAVSAGDAVSIFDGIEALPYPFDKSRLTGEKRKTLALGRSLSATPAEAAALRDRQAKLPAET